jgi:hypothetical protein
MAKRGTVPVGGREDGDRVHQSDSERTIKIVLTGSEEILQRIADLMLFSPLKSGMVDLAKKIEFELEPDYVDPVLATEVEDVRSQLRPTVQAFATKHGIQMAKSLLQECGTTGISTANAEALAQLRHYFTKYEEAHNGKGDKDEGIVHGDAGTFSGGS